MWIIGRVIRLLLAFVILASTSYCHSLVIYSPLVYGSCWKNICKRIYERLNWAELSFAHINILHNAALIHIKSVGVVSVRRCMCSMFHTKLMLPMQTHGPRFLNCFSSATFYKFILKKKKHFSHPYYFLIILIQKFFFHYFQALKFTHGSKPN